jgi:hypothetical protein
VGQLVNLGSYECNLTHSSDLAVHMHACYLIAVDYLIKNGSDTNRAIDAFGAVVKYVTEIVD